MSGEMSRIEISRSFSAVSEIFRDRFVVTDDNVYALYGDLLKDAKRCCVIPHGEDSKTLTTLEKILVDMAAAKLDRKSTLVVFGGGVIGDLGGFAAAVYMRGIDFINVPTTLLAQVDSSIGGKTGVDLKDYKNMAGAFHLPSAVVICTDFLKTLPAREIRCGLGEALKTALLHSPCMDEWKKLPDSAFCGDGDAGYFPLVNACARFKESVTNGDFKESGRRKILNLGHTVGHALEYLDRHELSHGLYVTCGLEAEAGVARSCGFLSATEYEKICALAKPLLGSEGAAVIEKYGGKEIAAAATADKKNSGGKISLMISDKFCQSEHFFTESDLAREIDNWKSDL